MKHEVGQEVGNSNKTQNPLSLVKPNRGKNHELT